VITTVGVLGRSHEVRGHECTGVELEHVGGGVVDHRHATATWGAVDFDDGGADQLVDPECVGVVDRLGVEHGARERFGGGAFVDTVEVDPPPPVRPVRLGHGVPTVSGEQTCPDGDAFGSVGGEIDEDVSPHPVRTPDPADLQQPLRHRHAGQRTGDVGRDGAVSRGIRCRARRRPWRRQLG
jgi:hypothetical protein